MSSTKRGAQRQEVDYYVTQVEPIIHFLREWFKDEPEARRTLEGANILDPCAGGNAVTVEWEYKKATENKPAEIIVIPPTEMSYPRALHTVLIGNAPSITTVDARPDSLAQHRESFLTWKPTKKFAASITNPPFFLAREIIERSLEVVNPGGYVAMLLRLNWLGSEDRFEWLQGNLPGRAYVHHKRMGFLPGGKKTDSVEYMHAVWKRGQRVTDTRMRVI